MAAPHGHARSHADTDRRVPVTVQGAGEGEIVSALSDDTVVALLGEAEEACQRIAAHGESR